MRLCEESLFMYQAAVWIYLWSTVTRVIRNYSAGVENADRHRLPFRSAGVAIMPLRDIQFGHHLKPFFMLNNYYIVNISMLPKHILLCSKSSCKLQIKTKKKSEHSSKHNFYDTVGLQITRIKCLQHFQFCN